MGLSLKVPDSMWMVARGMCVLTDGLVRCVSLL